MLARNEHFRAPDTMTIPSFEYKTGLNASQDKPMLCVDSIAGLLRGQKWGFDAHSHDNLHQIFWINRGTGRVQIDGSQRGFGPNTVVFVPAGTVHGFEFNPSSAGWALTMSDSSPLPVKLPDHAVQFPLVMREDQAAITALCDEINREQSSSASGKDLALACQAGLVSVWLVRQLEKIEDAEMNASPGKKLMRRFVKMLENKYASLHSVSNYADSLEVTPTHLTRVCRQTSGKSATGLIQDRTLLEARRRLALTDQKVAKIAEDLGFRSAAYFTRLFTQKTGESPSAFRKKVRQANLAGVPAPKVSLK